MGLSALGTAIAVALIGDSPHAHMISRMFYTLGFIVVIVGRSQLFTENTLYPVALVLAEKKEFWNTLRLWAVVLPANVAGALGFALIASWTPALNPDVRGGAQPSRGQCDCASRFDCVLVGRDRRMDNRPGGVDGFRVALHYRFGGGDLAADLYRGPGRFCALHREFVRDSGHCVDGSCAVERVSPVVRAGRAGKYLRGRRAW